MTWMSTGHVANKIGVNPQTVRRWCDRPLDPIPHCPKSPGGRIYNLKACDVAAWMWRHRFFLEDHLHKFQMYKVSEFMDEYGESQ